LKSIKGYFKSLQPYVLAEINNGILVFGKGNLKVKIDTGFDGALCIPEEFRKKLDCEFAGTILVTDYKMKARNEKFYLTKIYIGKKLHEFDFITGDFLIGMEFLNEIFSKMDFNFDSNKILLKLKS